MQYALTTKPVRLPLNGVITELPTGKVLDGDNAVLVLSDPSLEAIECDAEGKPLDAPKPARRSKPAED